ncbi:MAG: YceD family protein [Gammaproteobacteria bacterium]
MVGLPRFIQPLRLAEAEAVLEGLFSIQECTDLKDLLLESPQPIKIQWRFGRDKAGYSYIVGTIDGELTLTCQRCMKPMVYLLHVDVSLSPVIGEVIKLPKDYEALMLVEDNVSLASLVEEEILLNLPMAPKHDEMCAFNNL